MLWGTLHRMYIEGLKGALSSVVGKDHISSNVLHNAARVTARRSRGHGDRDNLNFKNTHQSCISTPRPTMVCSLIAVKHTFGIALRVAVNVPLSWVDSTRQPGKSKKVVTFMDKYIPAATAPSRKVLTKRIIPKLSSKSCKE